jgi:hypothetical protein
MSRSSVVGTATVQGLDDRGIGVPDPVGSRILTSPYCPGWLWGPRNLVTNGYKELLPPDGGGGNATAAKVKQMSMYTSTPPYAFWE